MEHNKSSELFKMTMNNGSQPLVIANKNMKKLSQPVELASEGSISDWTKTIDVSQINHKYQFGFTLLHYAAKENRLEVIEYLVSNGCDINAVDDEGQTPLHKSTAFGQAESVKLLIDKGANVNQIDNNGNTPLHVVIMTGGDFNIVKVLIEKANLGIQNNDEQNILHVAVRHHKVDIISLILNHKQVPSLITTTDKDGLTPIHLAVNPLNTQFGLRDAHGTPTHFDTTEKLLKRPQITMFGNTNIPTSASK